MGEDPMRETEFEEISDTGATKAKLRARLLAARSARTATELARARQTVARHVLARAGRCGWQRVAAYEPLRTEPGSVDLLDQLALAGITVLVPITLSDHDLDWTVWPAPVRPLGVDAITSADAVLAPALAVGADGARLGRGGGSYDRALARVGHATAVAAVLFDDELLPAVPVDPWDRPVTAVVRPAGWWTPGMPVNR